jgi:hypothetical protein
MNLDKWKELCRYDHLPALPIFANVDILVVGGGAAGVAAATLAAEAGKSTMLIEKYGFCGGSAVAGMSGTICGMFMATDDEQRAPEQLVYGFTERFYQNLRERGGATEPQAYGKTYAVTHDPLMWQETADFLLRTSGVQILYHSAVSDVIMEGNNFKGVVVDSNAGRSVILAERIIDASGDATLIARAGQRYFYGDNGAIQNPTMMFRLGGIDMGKFISYYGENTICPAEMTEKIDTVNRSGEYNLPRNKIWIFPTTRTGELLVNATRIASRECINVIDPADFTESEIEGRIQLRAYADFLRQYIPGCETSFVVDSGTEVGIRQTRSIVGRETLTNEDVVSCRKRSDGICRVPWPIELHSGNKPKLHWLLDDYYEVSLSTLIPEVGENLIVAGRCLSAEHEALASARVTAQCFEYGHAAGIAAVLSMDKNIGFHSLNPEWVREEMKKNGSNL